MTGPSSGRASEGSSLRNWCLTSVSRRIPLKVMKGFQSCILLPKSIHANSEGVGIVTSNAAPLVWRRVAVSLLLCCGFVFALLPQHATASCGDYLQMLDQHATPSTSVGETVDLVHGGLPSVPGGLPSVPRRCDGPGCSKSPGIPVANLAVSPKLIPIKFVAALSSNSDDDDALPFAFPGVTHSYSFRLSSDIFRPPRPLSSHC